MKLSTLSKIGVGAGLIFALYSGFRYFVLWTDYDRLVAYVAVGLLWAFCFWNYNKSRVQDGEINNIKQTLTSVEDRFVEYKENLEEKGITELV